MECLVVFKRSSPYVISGEFGGHPFLLLAHYVRNVAKRSVWEQGIYWGPTTDRPTDRPTRRPTDLSEISNGHISVTGHPIHFMFGSTVGFSRSADRMALFAIAPNPPSWKISNGHISGMSYPIHFHELQSSLQEYPTGENNARGVIRLVTI